MKIFSQNSNTSQYLQGDIPDYMANLVGSPSVDVSRISSSFSSADKAVQLVNQFDGSLLRNISVIFNSSDFGSYGVYVPAIDQAIKTKALGKMLQQKGYQIKDENGVLVAHPTTEEKSQDKIQQDIDTLYKQLESQGGTVFGINMQKVISAATDDFNNIKSSYSGLMNLLIVLHLGATMVHEAVHAKGSHSEGPSEAFEAKFIQWVLPKINEEYKNALKNMGKEEEFSPIIISDKVKHANSKNWYKVAQSTGYVPQHFFNNKPTGSDLSGRGGAKIDEQAMPGWDFMSRMYNVLPIEQKLGRQNMSELPPDLSQENDITELQLRKVTRDTVRVNPTLGTEGLLAKDRKDAMNEYLSIEERLDENRPHALLKPMKKASREIQASIIKTATLFGWMNNLDISDGSTIPGLGDRVMAWDDRDEDFAEEEKWIRQQPRYNPTYDIKGFYYRWIEPQYAPQLWTDVKNDVINTTPAKRFGSIENQLVPTIMHILNNAFKCLKNNTLKATRFIVSEDMSELFEKLCDKNSIEYYKFELDKKDEVIYAYWIFANVSIENIKEYEKAIQEKNIDDTTIEEVFGKPLQKRTIQKVIETAKEICKDKFDELYLIGSYAREKFMGIENPDVNELDFNTGSIRTNIQLGHLMAGKLGVKEVKLNKVMEMSFVYKGIKVTFYGGFLPDEIKEKMLEKGICTNDAILSDIFNRDFDINMAMYNVKNNEVVYPIPDIKMEIGVLKTFFDANFIISLNPEIILRALILSAKYGLEIDHNLEMGIIQNMPRLKRIKNVEEIIGNYPEIMELLEKYGY